MADAPQINCPFIPFSLFSLLIAVSSLAILVCWLATRSGLDKEIDFCQTTEAKAIPAHVHPEAVQNPVDENAVKCETYIARRETQSKKKTKRISRSTASDSIASVSHPAI
jgi:hypothetical protein